MTSKNSGAPASLRNGKSFASTAGEPRDFVCLCYLLFRRLSYSCHPSFCLHSDPCVPCVLSRLYPSIALDVGIIQNHGWAVIECNAAFSSGIYGCDPLEVPRILRRACGTSISRLRYLCFLLCPFFFHLFAPIFLPDSERSPNATISFVTDVPPFVTACHR